MGTGIVSIASYLLGFNDIASALLYLNVGIYITVLILSLLKITWFARLYFQEIVDHRRGPGFFSIIAGSCVLGSQFVLIDHEYAAALVLWIAGIVLWVFATYAQFAAFIIKTEKPKFNHCINGSWLLSVVAPQSISVLGSLLSTNFNAYSIEIGFLALSLWLWGGMLYIWLMSQIFYRLIFLGFAPQDMEPTYWINMGAMAISTLAGSLLIENFHNFHLVAGLLSFLEGFTLFFWVTGTWWIPILVVLEYWQHCLKRIPLSYGSQVWSAIFPLGMYAAGTHQMSRALNIGFLDRVPTVFLVVAMATWIIAFSGMVKRIALTFRS